ncbi:unnamed protein product [Arctogadus glacialis]
MDIFMDPAVMTSFLVVGGHVLTAAGVWLYRRHRRRSQKHSPALTSDPLTSFLARFHDMTPGGSDIIAAFVLRRQTVLLNDVIAFVLFSWQS